VADWCNFTYNLQNTNLEIELSVSLPHNPNEKISLKNINGLSFRDKYKSVLKDKTFTVFDKSGKEVFQGYIIEIGKEKRPAFGYVSLLDLLDSLIENPLGETTRKRCQYKFDPDGIEEDDDFKPNFQYSGSESFYFMYVSFQKLYDSILEISTDQTKLDNLGFRLPGSLVNIIMLVNESLEAALKEQNEDSLLFHFFLIAEVNRCLDVFNKYYISGEKFEFISLDQIKKNLKFNANDEKFISKIKSDFGYVNV